MMQPFSSALIAIIIFVASSPTFANDERSSGLGADVDVEANEDDLLYLFSLTLEDLTRIPVTVASRYEQPLNEAPSSVTVYLRQDILNMGIETLDDLLNFVPGVYSNRTDLRGQLAIFRGHATSDCSRGVLVLMNGARTNDPVCGGALHGLSYISMMNVERVEIIRGPGSAVYGSNAMVGVINIITRSEGNKISISAGSIGSKEIGLMASKAFGEAQTSIFARYSKDDGKHYEPFYSSFGNSYPTSDPLEAFDIMGGVEIGALTLDASVFYRKNSEFITTFGAYGDLNGKQFAENLAAQLHLKYDISLAPNINMSLYTDYRYNDRDVRTLFIPANIASQIVWTDGSLVDYEGGNYRTGDQFQLGFDGLWNVSDNHKLSFGAEYRREATDKNGLNGNVDIDLLFTTNGTQHNPLPPGDHQRGFFGGIFGLPFTEEAYFLVDAVSRNVFGGYIQDEYQLTEQLNLTGGIRFDSYEEIGSKATFRGALVYTPSENSTLKLMFGQAYRAPSLYEYYGETIATGAIGNPELGPETVDTFELSAAQRVGKAQLTLTWFNNSFKNGIQNVLLDDSLGTGIDTFQPQNVGVFTTRGWEAEALLQLSDSFTARGGLSFYDEVDDVGAAKTIGFWAFNYHTEGWNFNLNGYYRGSVLSQKANGQTIMNDMKIKSYTHWNAKVSYDIADNIEVYGVAQNLLNKDYRNYTSLSDLPEGVPMRDRIVKVGLIWSF